MPDMSIAIAIMLGSFIILLMLRMPISFTLGISSGTHRTLSEIHPL